MRGRHYIFGLQKFRAIRNQ